MKEICTVEGVLLGDEISFSLGELSSACRVHADWIVTLVDEGILEPEGRDLSDWRFSSTCLHRARSVHRFQRDLGVNLAGAALALELLERLAELQGRLNHYEGPASDRER